MESELSLELGAGREAEAERPIRRVFTGIHLKMDDRLHFTFIMQLFMKHYISVILPEEINEKERRGLCNPQWGEMVEKKGHKQINKLVIK